MWILISIKGMIRRHLTSSSTVLVAALCAAIMAFCVSMVPALGDGDAHPSQRTAGIAQAPKLLSIQLFRTGQLTGFTAIGPERGLSSYGNWIPPGKFIAFDAKISEKQWTDLALMVSRSELREFRPQSEWFTKEPDYIEGGCFIVLSWEDKELVFTVPSEHVRGSLPSSAKRKYELMDQIVERIIKLEAHYYRESKVRPANGKDAPENREYHRRFDRYWSERLPKEAQKPT